MKLHNTPFLFYFKLIKNCLDYAKITPAKHLDDIYNKPNLCLGNLNEVKIYRGGIGNGCFKLDVNVFLMEVLDGCDYDLVYLLGY